MLNTITSNEQQVRLRIFEGDLPVDKAYEELLRIEKEQRKSSDYFNDLRISRLTTYIRELEGRT